MIVLLSVLPFISTTLGGLAVLRLRHRLHPIMGLAAGMVLATALADLLPEANDLAGADHGLLLGGLAMAGYLAFSGLDALVHKQTWEHQHQPHQDPHTPHEHGEARADGDEHGHGASVLSLVGSGGLIVHSTMDGLAIGLGFQASTEVGLVVALAVVAHDFADGINVVTLALQGGQRVRTAAIVLALDAIAPVIGVVIGSYISVSERTLAVLLATFAGVFVAIGASHLLPEAQHSRADAAPAIVGMAALGALIVVVLRNFVG